MLWINVDHPTGAWKLHEESCRFCIPKETKNKGLEELKQDGGWIRANSYKTAYEYFKKNHSHNEYWQPCKVCNPKT